MISHCLWLKVLSAAPEKVNTATRPKAILGPCHRSKSKTPIRLQVDRMLTVKEDFNISTIVQLYNHLKPKMWIVVRFYSVIMIISGRKNYTEIYLLASCTGTSIAPGGPHLECCWHRGSFLTTKTQHQCVTYSVKDKARDVHFELSVLLPGWMLIRCESGT